MSVLPVGLVSLTDPQPNYHRCARSRHKEHLDTFHPSINFHALYHNDATEVCWSLIQHT